MGRYHQLTALVVLVGTAALAVALPLVGFSQSEQSASGPATPLFASRPDPMLARPCAKDDNCMHHWSLTSRLGDILENYESQLGARNRALRILGIEFTTGARPQTWYPDFGQGARSVIVQLTANAREDQSLALFQLGHEAFHLIDPSRPGEHTSVFEEGLASYFALAYMAANKFKGSERHLREASYRRAYELVARLGDLVSVDNTQRHSPTAFVARLKRLRERTRSFSRLSPDDIRAVFPEAPARMADELARKFGEDHGEKPSPR